MKCLDDKTRPRRAATDRRNNAALDRDLPGQTNDLVVQFDQQGKLTYLNPAAERVLELPGAAWRGLEIFDLFVAEDRDPAAAVFLDWVTRRTSTASWESRIASRSGMIRKVLWTVSLHFDSRRRPSSVRLVGHELQAATEPPTPASGPPPIPTDEVFASKDGGAIGEEIKFALYRPTAQAACEISNLLAGVMNCFQLIKSIIPGDHRYHEYAELIEKEMEQIGQIARQMFETEHSSNRIA